MTQLFWYILGVILVAHCSTTPTAEVAGENAEKLLVSLYYESLCPWSQKFVTDQLYPYYAAFKDYIDVFFVPYGKATSTTDEATGGVTFECQHGPPECVENMLQSCMLYWLNGQPDAKMELVACQMNSTFIDHTGRTCAVASQIPWTAVDNCMQSKLGVQLQLEAERQTHTVRVPYPEGVPTVTIDNVYDKAASSRATADFAAFVCELIDGRAPACEKSNFMDNNV